jgi:hypothetical protein
MIRYSSNTFRHRIALLCDGPKYDQSLARTAGTNQGWWFFVLKT